ncbi:ABC transporter permease [Salinibacterium sp.]|uniref:ABC transporter permease n=1 Tax=Salinibacterium sp. TaxID=1915057 RepID=UPI00286D3853|nr:ABC transporter permease [Salinibacterium sp.]
MPSKAIGIYLLKRIALLVPLAIAVTFFVFILQSLIPGGPIAALLQGKSPSAETIAALQAKFNLDKPLYEQYWIWLSHAARGDLGISIASSQSVSAGIGQRLGVTLILNLVGMCLCLVVGVPMGIIAAYRRGSWADRFVVGLNVFWSGAPHFVIAIVALFVFGYVLGWFPIVGVGDGSPGSLFSHLVLPCFVMALGPLGFITRLTRASMLENLSEDYVTFARARGLGFWTVLVRYALRNSLVPIITGIGLVLIGLLTGTVFVETVFGIPGLGGLLVSSVVNVDFPVVQGLVLIIAAWIVFANLIIDAMYAIVDPRVGFGKVAQ